MDLGKHVPRLAAASRRAGPLQGGRVHGHPGVRRRRCSSRGGSCPTRSATSSPPPPTSTPRLDTSSAKAAGAAYARPLGPRAHRMDARPHHPRNGGPGRTVRDRRRGRVEPVRAPRAGAGAGRRRGRGGARVRGADRRSSSAPPPNPDEDSERPAASGAEPVRAAGRAEQRRPTGRARRSCWPPAPRAPAPPRSPARSRTSTARPGRRSSAGSRNGPRTATPSASARAPKPATSTAARTRRPTDYRLSLVTRPHPRSRPTGVWGPGNGL